jgi:tripartite tricarboxylate transporter family receptor
VTTTERLPFLPEVPTIDSFLKGDEAAGWIGFGVPKGTPPEIIATLNQHTNAAVLDPNIKKQFATLGAVAAAELAGRVRQVHCRKYRQMDQGDQVRGHQAAVIWGTFRELRRNLFEPCALFRGSSPTAWRATGDGNASRYNSRDRRLGPLRWEMGRVREYITKECCNRADRRLPSGTIDCPIHLCEKSNCDGCADDSAYRGAEYVLETERGENISTRHYEKAGEPRPSKLFSSGASKPTRAQIIQRIEDAELEASH